MIDARNIEDFSLLVLVHMASVDGTIHPTEQDAIVEKVRELFPHLKTIEDRLALISQAIKKMGKESSEKMIEENLDQLHTLSSGQKKTFYALLFDVINADGRVNEEETRTLRMLKSFFLTP